MSATPTVPDTIDLRELEVLCRELYDDGERYIKAMDAVAQLDLTDDPTGRSGAGRALCRLENEGGPLEKWGDSGSGGGVWQLTEGTGDA